MRIFISLILSIFSCMSFAQKINVAGLQTPVAVKKPNVMTLHGNSRTDNYYWMKDRENKEVIDHLNAENEYLDKSMAPLKGFQEKLFEEMKGRIKEQDESVPYKDGNFYYYSKYITGGEYPVYCRKTNLSETTETVLLDGNAMAKGEKYFSIGGFEISDNEEIMAFGTDVVSRRNYVLQFKNLKTGEIYADKIQNTEGGSYAWAADNKTFFYVIRDQTTLLGNKVYRHTLGTDVSQDQLVYEEKDNQYYMGIGRSKSKKYVMVYSGQNGVATEVQLLEANKPMDTFKTFLKRKKGHEYSVDHYQDKFYIKTNLNGAKNYQLMEVKEADHAQIAKWKVKIAHRADVFLEGLEVFKNFLVIQERKAGLIQIRVMNQKAKTEHYLKFDDPAYDAYLSTNPNFDTDILRFGYTSLTTPNSTFDYNMIAKTKDLKKQQAVIGTFNVADYKSERIFVTARDGAKVPVSIVYHKNTALNGTAPLLQYAYGSYGSSMDATFSANRLSLLDRGFVYAICHIRGGQEMGRDWYENGKMFKKKNTFNDFVDCSKALIAKKYVAKDKLYAMGGSAGGLLMGAIMNQAPELYHGIVAAVPFVDVVTTMLDETIPLTTGEFEEWGNPKNKASYDYMLSYSPYDQVTAKNYPNVLVTTGLHDSQVQYWEPAKWVAKLRELKTDKNMLLMKTDMTAGHGGASGRFSALKDTALMYAFIMDLAGKAE